MKPVRKWGSGPYPVAVVYGGPGAPGEMAPVARELSAMCGVLEPFQTESTLEAQVRELGSVIADQGKVPVTLIGFSWGAFLSFMVAARYPALVKKLILVGCGPFEEEYVPAIMTTRLTRLPSDLKAEAKEIMAKLTAPPQEDEPDSPVPSPDAGGSGSPGETKTKTVSPSTTSKKMKGSDKTSDTRQTITEADRRAATLARFGALMTIADTYDPLPQQNEVLPVQFEVFRGVWEEAAELRRSSGLLRMGASIQCPVIAIHGDYDPHPAEGVHNPLERTVKNFRFVVIERCGHRPWIERYAADTFYKILAEEI